MHRAYSVPLEAVLVLLEQQVLSMQVPLGLLV
jgi:hypothetical protein